MVFGLELNQENAHIPYMSVNDEINKYKTKLSYYKSYKNFDLNNKIVI